MGKVFSAGDYLRVDNATLLLAPLAEGSNFPLIMTITTGGATAVSTVPTTISVTALTVPVWDGMILTFKSSTGTNPVKVKIIADAAAGATVINVAAVPTAIPAAHAASSYVVVPMYAAQSFNRSGSDQAENFATFNTVTGTTEELILGRNKQLSCKALTVASNPGLDLLYNADEGTGKAAQLYFQFIRDDGTGYKGLGNVKNFRETNEVQKAIEIQWEFGVSGKLYKLTSDAIL